MSLLNTFSKTLLLAVFVLLIGCSSSNATPLAEISPQQAAEIVESNNAVIIDVRTQSEWDAGHIPGAIHIPLSEVKGRLDEFKAFDGKEIVMQCRSGKRSAAAGKILLAAGYEDVSNLTGGIDAWGKAKLPVEQ
ncbi:MAG: rhodanese-like domain-containing protein [Methylophaga sp.]|nr:rhodanese-like domain-containing protein [Methylophaga sp.]